MNGWMDGWMDGWMGGWRRLIYGLRDGCVGGWVSERMDGLVGTRMDS